MTTATISTSNTNLRKWVNRVLIYAVLTMFAVYFLLPLFVMLVNSFKELSEIRGGNLLLPPSSPTFEPWIKAWGSACTGLNCEGVSGYFINSLIITVPAVFLASAIGAINGYILSKWQFKGSELFFAFMLLGCFIPFQAILLPMAQTLGYLGLANSVPGLIFVHTIYGIPFTTLFYRNYYVGIPTELISAAKLDGASFFQTFFRIILPLSTPIIIVTVIWEFTNIWNDFLFGVIYSGPHSQPITVALNNLVNTSTGVKEYNVDMAAAMIAALPTILVYIISGKYFLRGLVAGAVKG